MKVLSRLFILTFTVAVTACNTETNPIKKYNNRLNDVPVSQRGEEKTILANEDDGIPKACPKPYTMSISDAEGKDAGRSLQFIVGQSKSYRIDLTSSQFQNLTLHLPKDSPKGLKLKATKSGVWNLSFKPDAVQDNLTEKIPLIVQVPQTDCIKGDESELLSINVNDGQPLPTVAILNLDQEKRYQSTDSIPFEVQVTDPALTADKTPNFPEFTYTNTFSTGETIFASSANAISCDRSTKVTDISYRFHCIVDVTKIKNPFPNQPYANTSFQVFARSVNKDLSDGQDATLTFQYPVNLPPPQTVAAPVSSDDSDSAKKTVKSASKKVSKKKKSKKTKTASSSSKSSSSNDKKSGDKT